MASCRGKTALVTNASDGPGAAAATALANAGAQVLVHDWHSTGNVVSIVTRILSSGGVAKAIAADISTAEGLQQLKQDARRIVGDRLDILVLNVTSATSASFLLVELLLPILNQGSSVSFMYPCSPRQTISKQVPPLADALSPRGVRVNAIEVSRTRTSFDPSRDIGAAITFLASNESSEITGATIRAHIKANTGRGRTPVGAARNESRR